MKTLTIIFVLFITEFSFAQTSVTVNINHIQNEEGKIYVGLYTQNTFMISKPDYSAILEVKNHSATALFKNVPAGEYAISYFQDTNDNHKLDFRPNGVPAEPYGVSNHGETLYGPPQWSASKFAVAQDPVTIKMK